MLYTHLKQGLRLNRTITFSFLFYHALALYYTHVPFDQARIIAAAGLAVLFLLATEVALRATKHRPNMEALLQEKCSVLLPILSCGFVAASYLLTGQLFMMVFATITLLQAQLFAHIGLTRIMLALYTVLYLATLPLGYPHLLGFSNPPYEDVHILALLTPFAIAVIHYGNIVAAMVRNTSTKVMKLQSLAATDALTGLINRRQFNHQLHAEISRAKRHRSPLSLALFDIDDFKKLNDFYGHTTGDRVLKELGLLITNNVRESDIPARYGGEEFALILPETSQSHAYELLERLRSIIEGTVFCLPDIPITTSISVGVAQLDWDHAKGFELVEQADAALYEAKRQGKNRVVYGVLLTPKVVYHPFGTK